MVLTSLPARKPFFPVKQESLTLPLWASRVKWLTMWVVKRLRKMKTGTGWWFATDIFLGGVW